MRRIVLALVLITVIAVAFAAWFFLNLTNNVDQTNDANQISNVKITKFSTAEHWSYLGGMAVTWPFNVTIQNMGVNDVNVTLVVLMFGNGSAWGNYSKGPITIRAGEKQEIGGEFITAVDFSPETYVATVNLFDEILDERRLP